MNASRAFGAAAVAVASVAAVFAGGARAAEVVGPTLPLPVITSTFTGGGFAPDFADTFATPFSTAAGGAVTSWKVQFLGGVFPPIGIDEGGPFASGPEVPAGVQLKVFRHVGPTTLQVVAAGAVHDPRPILVARLPGYPFFLSTDSVVEFTEPGLVLEPGDVVGLTIMSDPAIGRYAYILAGSGDTPIVQRNVAVGGTIDLADIYTGALPWPPALEVDLAPLVTHVAIDVKPGSDSNPVNAGASGTLPVAILSSPSFDAMTVDVATVTLAGAHVATRPNGTPMAGAGDVNGDGRLDLVVHFATNTLALSTGDTSVTLEAKTADGTRIEGSDAIRVIG